jgi:hypothetical protein
MGRRNVMIVTPRWRERSRGISRASIVSSDIASQPVDPAAQRLGDLAARAVPVHRINTRSTVVWFMSAAPVGTAASVAH